jgi:hypothetical protein
VIRATYRVQCSGTCGLWLAGDGGTYSDIELAAEWISSSHAEWAARGAGWHLKSGLILPGDDQHVYCLGCWALMEEITLTNLPVMGTETTLTDLPIIQETT